MGGATGLAGEDFAALTTVANIQRMARDWEANNRNSEWLGHTGKRLEEAETVANSIIFASHLPSRTNTIICTRADRNQMTNRCETSPEIERKLKEGEADQIVLARRAVEEREQLAAMHPETSEYLLCRKYWHIFLRLHPSFMIPFMLLKLLDFLSASTCFGLDFASHFDWPLPILSEMDKLL